MKPAARPLWLNSQLPQLLQARVLWSLQALPLAGLVLSFVPWLIWLVPRIETRYPTLQPMTGEILGVMLVFMVLMLVGIVAGMWLGWRLNEQVCRRLFGWPADAVDRVFRQSQLPATWLKAGIAPTDVGTDAARAVLAQRQSGMAAYALKVGVLRWGLMMFVTVAVVPKLLQGTPLHPRVLAVQALIWSVAGACFGLVLWATERARLSKRPPPNSP